MFKTFLVGALTVILAACGVLKPHNPARPNPAEPAAPLGQQFRGKLYRIDESRSELRILVYRAGPLAHLGHNHVMVNRALRGAVNLMNAPVASVFQLIVPVAGFVVDDAQARREEGSDFDVAVPEDAKSGTLHNMQSAAVLDADEFPVITVNSVAIRAPPDAGAANSMIATVAISVAGHDSKIDVPFTLQMDANQLSASGSLEIRQSALGLTPYSLMLGALQVQDAMMVKFKIVAAPD